MKIVVIGGSGLIGSKTVAELRLSGHEAVVATPSTGVDTVTGQGLEDALRRAAVVIDVSNSPSFEPAAVMEFFTTATRNIIDAERAAGVGHHVVLSVVGTERLVDSGYFRAKMAQEQLIGAAGLPFTIVHATQFFEFFPSIADAATDGDTVRLAPVDVEPIAAQDVALEVARAAMGDAVGGVREIGGPDRFRLDEFVRRGLASRGDPRRVVADASATYFGARLSRHELVPSQSAARGTVRFVDWLCATAP